MSRCDQCGLNNLERAPRCLRCGAPLVGELTRVLIGGQYTVEAEIGRGSMGVVYRARDVNLGRPVALKVISPELAANSTFVARFRREASTLATIRNDHVVQVYAMGEHDGAPYYAMEYIEGSNLEQVIREHLTHGTFVPVYRALTILKQVALGLEAVHAKKLVHRDVKPANIVIEDCTGRPVLLDFGLARPRDDPRARADSTHAAGTPGYMSPEQIDTDGADDRLGPPADIYGLGCTAVELLTGAPPFQHEGLYAVLNAHLREPAPTLSSRRPELAILDPIVARSLEKLPSARFPSAAAFADAFEGAAMRWRSIGTPIPVPLTSPPSWRPAPADEARPLLVLVVDDDAVFCRVASQAARLAITERPVRVVEASSGVRALTACLEQAPDLVVLDYDMPEATGIDVLSELRSLPGAAHATVMVVSSSVGEVERWRFSALGVRDFLAKPVVFDELVDAIRRLTAFANVPVAATSPFIDAALPILPARAVGLPEEVFLLLLAVGWADGSLDPIERDAVLAAAEVEGLSPSGMEALRRAALTRVELGDIDVSRLRTPDRRYVYAVARWIALLDGEFPDREAAALRILGFSLRMPQAMQTDVDVLVRDVMEATSDASDIRVTLMALREAVRRGITA